MGILKRLLSKKTKSAPSLDSVRFSATGFSFQGELGGARVWHSPEGDGIGLYFFPVRPDLPENAKSLGDLRDTLQAAIGDSGAQLVQIRFRVIDHCQSVEQVIKIRQEPRGFTYVGSIIIPFEEFSFVVKVQCQERGMTGMREAILMAKALQSGTMMIRPTGADGADDVSLTGEWNPDDERYDAISPDHPLSRVRRILSEVAVSLYIEPTVKLCSRFPLPVDGSQ